MNQFRYGSRSFVLFILAVAFLIRLYVMTTQKVVIENEGAEYARLAENILAGKGFASSLEEQPNLMYAPLFPLLISLVTILINNSELAGRLVSVVSGALLIVPMYLIGLRLYSRRTAQICAGVVALHPLLIGFSTTVLTEAIYLTFMMSGVYWGCRCLQINSLRSRALAGIFFGLAYLTRPEALVFSLLTVLLVVVSGLIQHHGSRRIIQSSGVVIASFAVLAIPYVLFLRSHTGKFILEAKSKLNYTIGTRFNSGMPYNQAAWGISEELAEEGPLRESYRYAAFTPYPTGTRDIARYLVITSRRNKEGVYQTLVSSYAFGPVLLMLAFLGCFGEGWNPHRLVGEIFLISVLLCMLVVLLSAHLLQFRYFLPLLPVFIVWASRGIEHLSHWAKITASGLAGRVFGDRFAATVQSLCCLMLILIAVRGAGYASELVQGNQEGYPLKEAGLWLKHHYPGSKSIMTANSIVVPYYSQGTMMALPYAESSVALKYIHTKKPDFVVLEGRLINLRPYIQQWLENGISDAAARLIYSQGNSTADKIAIFKLEWRSH